MAVNGSMQEVYGDILREISCPPPEVLDKNIRMVRSDTLSEIDIGLARVNNVIGNGNGGLTDELIKITKKAIYKIAVKEELKRKGVGQFDTIIKWSRKYLENGDSFDKIVNCCLNEYLSFDVMYPRCNHRHPKIEDVLNLYKDEVEGRLAYCVKLLAAEGDTFDGLVVNAFPDKNILDAFLNGEYESVHKKIEMVKKNPRLIRLPSGIRDEIISIIEEVFKYSKDRLNFRHNEMYKNNGNNGKHGKPIRAIKET